MAINEKHARRVSAAPRLRPEPEDMGLHLALDLALVLESEARGDDGVRRLENARSCLPGLAVTFFTDLQAGAVLDQLILAGIRQPDHLIAEAGKVVQHLDPAGELNLDPSYGERLGPRNGTRPRPGAAKGIALEYLDTCWGTPRPLMVVGRPGPDSPMLDLADIPVLTDILGRRGKLLAYLTCRVLHQDAIGLTEVVRILLAYVASGPGRHGRPATRTGPAFPDLHPPSPGRPEGPGTTSRKDRHWSGHV